MAHINNQWLKANPERKRNHGPIEITISPQDTSNSWDLSQGVIAQIEITRKDGDYQQLLLNQADVAAVVQHLFASPQSSAAAVSALVSMGPDALLALFKRVLSEATE